MTSTKHQAGLLLHLNRVLKNSPPIQLEGETSMRASVALLLRVRGLSPDTYLMPQNVVSTLTSEAPQRILELSTPENTELLFIKRWERSGDPWSGHVAFPGGKAEIGETDLETTLRETKEEIGLDLSKGSFVCLGQLNEAPIYGSGKKRQGSVYIPFVFLLCNSNETTPLKLQEGEVLAARWVKLSHLISGLEYRVKTPFRGPSSVGLDQMYWPSIDFPSPVDTPESPTSSPLLSSAEMVRENVIFRLWGMTLRATTELIEKCGLSTKAISNSTSTSTLKSSNYPLVRFHDANLLLNPLASTAIQWSFYIAEASRRARTRSISFIIWLAVSIYLTNVKNSI
jgi:8-oxo-dGTP pyrophosphatase MutT (NUDIX family)